LVSLGAALLVAEDDARAAAAFQRAVQWKANAPVIQRALVLSQIVTTYLDGQRDHLRSALEYMAQFDALGPAVAGRRLSLRNDLYAFARDRDTLPLMEAQAQAALRTSAELTGDDRLEWGMAAATAYVNRADYEARQGHFAAALEAIHTGDSLLSPANPGVHGYFSDQGLKYRVYGKPVHPVIASFVYWPGKATPDSAIARPRKGHISIYAVMQYHDAPDVATFSMLQRIIGKYGSTVDVTVLEQTTGYNSQESLVAEGRDEAKSIADFYHGYMKLPAPVAVFDRPVEGKREDGALERRVNPNEHGYFGLLIYLIDADGNIRNIDNGGEVRLIHLINELSH